MFPIELFNVKTNPAKSTWNLGVIFDKKAIFHSHISGVCSSCFYHSRDLWCIHHHLDLDSATLLALTFCMVLQALTSLKIKCVQNRLAHVVTKSPPFTRSVPLLRSLHWSPVKYRILFNISLLTYKMLHACPIIPIPFTEIKQRNSPVSPWGQDQHRHKSFSLLCLVSLEQPAAVCPFSHFSCNLQETSEDTSL